MGFLHWHEDTGAQLDEENCEDYSCQKSWQKDSELGTAARASSHFPVVWPTLLDLATLLVLAFSPNKLFRVINTPMSVAFSI